MKKIEFQKQYAVFYLIFVQHKYSNFRTIQGSCISYKTLRVANIFLKSQSSKQKLLTLLKLSMFILGYNKREFGRTRFEELSIRNQKQMYV